MQLQQGAKFIHQQNICTSDAILIFLEIRNVLNLCNIFFFITVCFIFNRLGLAALSSIILTEGKLKVCKKNLNFAILPLKLVVSQVITDFRRFERKMAWTEF